MNQPLTAYFINSSHNTYLSGNQLTSRSKASRYVEDLYRGVLCIEIDTHVLPTFYVGRVGWTSGQARLYHDIADRF